MLAPPPYAPARSRGTWVYVRNLSMTDVAARAALARGDVEPGEDPREGVFVTDQATCRVRKVLRLRTGH